MLTYMGMLQQSATTILEDNQGAIALAQNAGYHARTKHVDIRHLFIRENVECEMITIKYIDTKNQLADILIISLGTKTLKLLRNENGITNKILGP
uniref:Polyprotein n=1 Tax=Peronospora matthiolae TaxID=2874970 RepID=A0AAV1T3Y7_9STRA